MEFAKTLANRIPSDSPLHSQNRAVAAIITDSERNLLSWATNTNAKNRTLHAEVNALQRHYAETGLPLPEGSRIYTSLKPCKMCAAMIWHCAADPASIRVFYGEDDPGPNAKLTVLTPGSFERKRASRNAAEVDLALESHLTSLD
jgi:tRNA(Arg) A34 adenosine deaminase TadA